jgi:hypothetical protein
VALGNGKVDVPEAVGEQPMKRIFQIDEDGCGVACVAMLAGVSYKMALTKMFGDRHVTPTTTKQIRKELRKFGLFSARKLVRSIKWRHYTELRQDAILKVKIPKRSGAGWHWIVWDAKRGKFLDPDGDDPM